MMHKIWIYAPNVHTGGAKNLLIAIVQSINNKKNYRLILDERIDKFYFNDFAINHITRPTIFSRLFSEWKLFLCTRKKDTVLLFGNLPPLFPISSFVINYYQSPFIIQKRSIKFFNFRTKLRIIFERFWFKLFKKNVNLYVVQSSSVRNEIKDFCANKVIVYPFIGKTPSNLLNSPKFSDREGFIYVSSGESHKNHSSLIQAWIELANMNLFPKLKLTLSHDKDLALIKLINESSSKHKLNIINLGFISHNDIFKNYLDSKAAIFPSKFETFGLPLYEAAQLGIPIIASERDFVRDIVNPIQTFDPDSPISIARAVERFISGDNTRHKVNDGSNFIAELESNFNNLI